MLFIFFYNRSFIYFKIDNTGCISEAKALFNGINMSSFGVCKYFIIYSEWDKKNLSIYTINTKKNYVLNFHKKVDFV